MRALCRPAWSMALRMWSSLGALLNFTYTRVPPLKSTPRGIPCQNSMLRIPAMLKTSEPPMKYHFLPRKSKLVFCKSSTYKKSSCLNTQGFTTLLPLQNRIQDHAGNEYRGKQVSHKSEGQSNGEAANRPCAKDK